MKRVRKRDLEILIAKYYSRFLDHDHKPINDIVDGHGEIKIDRVKIENVTVFVTNVANITNIKNSIQTMIFISLARFGIN